MDLYSVVFLVDLKKAMLVATGMFFLLFLLFALR
jgi:hypothetical protein